MYAWPPNLIPQVMQSAECSWGTSRVSSRYIDWWYCIGTLKVVGVGGHKGNSRYTDWRHCINTLSAPAWGWWVGVVYTGDAGFHGGHNAVIQGAQIGGIVFASCQPLPGGGGWSCYIQVMQVFVADIKL